MNGAQALIRTFVGSGVDVCFANPGTSEMHFVAALDDVPEMRAVLGLFEGVVTGAADGYGRMAGRPGGHLVAPRAGAGQRHRQPPQRPAGPDPGREPRRRPRHHAPRLRPSRWPRTSRAWPGRCRAGSGHRCAPTRSRPTPWTPSRPRSGRPAGWPRWWCPPTCRGRRPESPPPADRAGCSATVVDDVVVGRGQGAALG